MSANGALAEIFAEMAAMLQLTGANAFRVNSYQRASRVMHELTADVQTLADDPGKLTALEGVGAGTAKRIIEFVEHGRVADHQKLLEQVPRGLLDLLKISGMGPKTVKLMWEKAGVTDVASLKRAMDSGELENLPGMGAKTIQNIRDSLAFLARSGQRMKIGVAQPIAEQVVAALSAVPGVHRVAFAGSMRRGRETIGDIDILASTDDVPALAEFFQTLPGVTKVLVGGHTKVSVRIEAGVQMDLRVVDDACYGAALLYFSGSKEHNVILRERAQKRGLRLNEYGLFPDDGDDTPPQDRGLTPEAAATEQEIYAALELPWIPPEMRENRGELAGPPPALITLDQIGADLHNHTVASDGHMTIDELAELARAHGLHTLAVTDHSPSSAQANGLSAERLLEHIAAVRAADARFDDLTILAGSEVDIHTDGTLDYDDEILAQLDVVVASPHAALRQEPAKATARLIKAIEHPLVHIIGHPTGRIINRRGGLEPAIDEIVAAAIEHDTALELNANFNRLDLRDTHVRAAVDAGALISINTDTHRAEQMDYRRYGVLTARRGWLTADQCINAWTPDRLRSWLERAS